MQKVIDFLKGMVVGSDDLATKVEDLLDTNKWETLSKQAGSKKDSGKVKAQAATGVPNPFPDFGTRTLYDSKKTTLKKKKTRADVGKSTPSAWSRRSRTTTARGTVRATGCARVRPRPAPRTRPMPATTPRPTTSPVPLPSCPFGVSCALRSRHMWLYFW
jgi:hypothetical protein